MCGVLFNSLSFYPLTKCNFCFKQGFQNVLPLFVLILDVGKNCRHLLQLQLRSWKPHWLWFCEQNCGHELILKTSFLSKTGYCSMYLCIYYTVQRMHYCFVCRYSSGSDFWVPNTWLLSFIWYFIWSNFNFSLFLFNEKPRRGCFEIREEGGKKFISLLVMSYIWRSCAKLLVIWVELKLLW